MQEMHCARYFKERANSS